jgi:maltose O-acetyltransferase
MGRNCTINHEVFLNGRSGILIGDNVILSARCMLLAAMLEPRGFSDIDGHHYVDAPISIGDGCWIGAGAIVLGGINIGASCIIGAGAVVTQDIPPYTVAVGNPARVIGSTVAAGGP